MKTGGGSPKNIDEYIAGFPRDVQEILNQIRTTIRKVAPDAEEAIKYRIPTFVLNGNLVHFAAFKNHIGFYPTPSGIAAFKHQLSRYKSAKGSVQFPIDKPMPLGLIEEIVNFRVKEARGQSTAKKRSLRPFVLLILIVLALAASFPSTAQAQWPAELGTGARVQARLPEVQYQRSSRRGHLIRGRITALAKDTLYLAVTDSVGPLAIPRSLIQRLELSRGVPSRGVSALRQGAITGIVGLLSGLLAYSVIDEPGGRDAGEAALIYGGVSFAAGAILGAIFPQERWRKLQLGP
jgi:uncharacterized protein YdhG (YjbR/CyaY superfamily)